MAYGVSNDNVNSFGTINKIRTNADGRGIYQVTGSDGKIAGHVSVAQKDCDIFEKSYNDLMSSASKLKNYTATHTEDDMKKMKKVSRWIVGLSAFAGGAMFMFRKNIKHPILKTIGGTIAGLIAGCGISVLTTTPPGSVKMAKASKTMSKLDIQPYENNI